MIGAFRTRWLTWDGGDPAGGTDPNAAGNADPSAGQSGEKTFTQAELDAIIQKRLDREGKKSEAEVQRLAEARAQELLKQQQMSEAERLKLAKDEAEQRAAQTIAQANARLLKAEAKAQALAAGVNPEYVDDVLALAQISGDAYLDNGEPSADKIRTSINAVLEKRPFYKAGATAYGSEITPGQTGTTLASLQQQYQEAQKAGDVSRMMSLTNQITELRKGA